MTKPLILTDIEGTTSSISFVKDVLFPYARRELPRFVREHGDDPEVRPWLDRVALEHGGICSDDVIVETLQGWIDEDRKHTALKALQGLLWEDGYRNADFRAHLYPDAAPALQRWHAAGYPLAVYSSGSVAAQKLFFGNSDAGDLRALFAAFFDTEMGHKRDPDSYRLIADALDHAPEDMVFLSDVVEELEQRARPAAHRATRPHRGLPAAAQRRRQPWPSPRAELCRDRSRQRLNPPQWQRLP